MLGFQHSAFGGSMLRILPLLSAGFLLASAIGCQTTGGPARADYTDAPIDSPTATLVVHGMSCPLCANNVDKQLLRVPGVQNVEIDMGDGSVRVQLADSPRPSKADLARAVDQTGFTLVSISTP
jgi:copper chaperone CopZ